MVSPEPNVRYYDTGSPSPRRWVLAGALAAVVVVASTVVAWRATDWFDGDTSSSRQEVGTGALPIGEGVATGAGGAGDGGSSVGLGVATNASSVVVVGDSITQGSAAEIEYTLAAADFTDVTVDGLASRRISVGGDDSPESELRAIERLLDAGTDPDVWVIALGTNDIGKYSGADEYAALVGEMVDLIPADRPLVWVDAFRADYESDSLVFDDALRARLGSRDGTVVVSWSDIVEADLSMLRDGVHPNRDGRAVFAAAIADGLAQLR
jgi:lysophospholipase L1-like esterase